MNIMTYDLPAVLPSYIPPDFDSFVYVLKDLLTIDPINQFHQFQYLEAANSPLIQNNRQDTNQQIQTCDATSRPLNRGNH